ncbi:MAG: hypothetical protein AB7H97_21320 [Pseudobdellovibrionaceae bacterium]
MDPADLLYLWPNDRYQQVEPILKDVIFVYADPTSPVAERNKSIIGIGKSLMGPQLWSCIGLGHQHLIQENRDDFAFSLVSTSLIATKSSSFWKSPLPFVFRSYVDGLGEQTVEQMRFVWKLHDEKNRLIDSCLKFLTGNARTRPYRDTVSQLIDEMISGSLPVDPTLNPAGYNTLTIAYSTDRLCLICKDERDGLPFKDIKKYFFSVSRGENLPTSGGNIWARLPVVVNLSTNFYYYSKIGSGSSMVVLIDMRKGLRDLESYPKNVHLFEVKNS